MHRDAETLKETEASAEQPAGSGRGKRPDWEGAGPHRVKGEEAGRGGAEGRGWGELEAGGLGCTPASAQKGAGLPEQTGQPPASSKGRDRARNRAELGKMADPPGGKDLTSRPRGTPSPPVTRSPGPTPAALSR